jgi:hypothetical protein
METVRLRAWRVARRRLSIGLIAGYVVTKNVT